MLNIYRKQRERKEGFGEFFPELTPQAEFSSAEENDGFPGSAAGTHSFIPLSPKSKTCF